VAGTVQSVRPVKAMRSLTAVRVAVASQAAALVDMVEAYKRAEKAEERAHLSPTVPY
jgi:hypothetical protein